MRKILLYSPLPPPIGGIATWTELILRTADQDAEIDIAICDSAVRWRSFLNRSPLVRLAGGTIQALSDLVRLSVKARKKSIDVIHICTSSSFGALRDALFCLFLRMGCRKIVFHYHTGALPSFAVSKGPIGYATRFVLRHADAVVVLNKQAEACVSSFRPNKETYCLPNPIDSNAIEAQILNHQPSPEDARYSNSPELKIVFIGHVIESKGVFDLLDALSRIGNQLVGKVRLLIVGSVTDAMRARIAEHKVTTSQVQVDVLGEVAHARAMWLLKQSDLMILPSHSEGFPMSVLEALALGVPVLATDVGAITDILQHANSSPGGFVVPVRRPDKIAAEISSIIQKPEELKKRGLAGYEFVLASYSPKRVFQNLVLVWQ